MKTSTYRILRIGGTFAIAGFIVYLLVDSIAGGEQFISVIETANWLHLWSALVMWAVFMLLAAVRWQVIIKAMGHTVGLKPLLGAVFATAPLALVAPARSSDFLRAAVIKDKMPLWSATGSILAKKFIDLQVLLIISIAGGCLTGFYALATSIGAVSIGLWLVLIAAHLKKDWISNLPFISKFPEKLDQIYLAFAQLKDKPAYLAVACGWTVLTWLLAVAILVQVGQIFSANISFVHAFTFWPISVVIGLLPITPAGMGTRDSAFLALLKVGPGLAGVKEASIIAATFGYWIMLAALPAIVGLPVMSAYAIGLSSSKNSEPKPPEVQTSIPTDKSASPDG